ncbi:MAG: type II toxin-antitoxin system CcdA family antitoxin [Gammaproteobacteria bacterium]|nr:type II toxin-antitoxin system CcdA family antitoxin [Gammaproteobacteria bacterium]MBT4787884.1 type II toxin-antitoxin system CcdA family antitoxin [Gammaproteobacteria bacterium]MBT6478924.1 type II toxin-antitoxin system CcdA family antitoxin [Gammaproteobacteria bacterium]MBT6653061.1 type II toxin-antitoxin system CcdA family antitoxin [Gammaproteobacteria bacterium]HIJ25760.1 type II toxin-antitoxin system CcdA family antitoxin [Gammaproteobacteria bacterium]
MQLQESSTAARRPTNLTLDSGLLKEAKALGINVSRSAERGIAQAVREHKHRLWLKENSEAIKSSNLYVENNGLPLSEFRNF